MYSDSLTNLSGTPVKTETLFNPVHRKPFNQFRASVNAYLFYQQLFGHDRNLYENV